MREDFYVYLHVKKTDSKCFYIGKGTKDRYKSKSGRNQHWYNVVNKHGFEPIILINNISEEKAFELEANICKQIGYKNLCNINEELGSGGHIMSEETKLKLYTKERNLKISNSNKGRIITWEKGGLKNKGRKLTKEQCKKITKEKTNHECYNNPERGEKISKALIGRETFWHYKPVLQYDLQGNFIKEWVSQKEVELTLNYIKGSISSCCRNKQKTAFGFIWKFKN
jgi:hypothetical protein